MCLKSVKSKGGAGGHELAKLNSEAWFKQSLQYNHQGKFPNILWNDFKKMRRVFS